MPITQDRMIQLIEIAHELKQNLLDCKRLAEIALGQVQLGLRDPEQITKDLIYSITELQIREEHRDLIAAEAAHFKERKKYNIRIREAQRRKREDLGIAPRLGPTTAPKTLVPPRLSRAPERRLQQEYQLEQDRVLAEESGFAYDQPKEYEKDLHQVVNGFMYHPDGSPKDQYKEIIAKFWAEKAERDAAREAAQGLSTADRSQTPDTPDLTNDALANALFGAPPRAGQS